MKKSLLLLIIIILGISNSVKAQNVKFGIKTGLNIANLNGGQADRNNLFNFHIGVISEFKLSEKISFQPELLYSRQGSEAKNSLEVKIDYLSIPLILKYYFFEKLSVEFGPQLSFLMNDKIDFIDSPLEFETNAESFDFGLNLGFGYDINSKFFIQLRYNYGITPIVENPDIKNSVFQISMGYKF